MLYLAGDDAIPGVTLGRVPWYKSFGWLFRAGKTSSVKDNTWISPLRQIALDTYRQINEHVAKSVPPLPTSYEPQCLTPTQRGDVKALKSLSAADYQEELLRRLKKQPGNLTFRWNLEREVTPTQIVSLRVAQYYMGKDDPKFGSRYLTHALVKFDTEQVSRLSPPIIYSLHLRYINGV
jgi:protein MBA1